MLTFIVSTTPYKRKCLQMKRIVAKFIKKHTYHEIANVIILKPYIFIFNFASPNLQLKL
jgi:hypothetical protein